MSHSSIRQQQRQKKLGPAPFASFDHSEDLSSPESKGYEPMPEIFEEQNQPGSSRCQSRTYDHETSASTSTAQTPTTPRIDVEQPSPSDEDSSSGAGDSTPEREIFGLDQVGANVASDFMEGFSDADLVEDFRSPSLAGKRTNSPYYLAAGNAAAKNRKVSWDAGDQRGIDVMLERKGSGGFVKRSERAGDAGFPGPRDTRLSSISSNFSGTSGLSGLSAFSRRSPSPHRMLLETSFCGPKTKEQTQQQHDMANQLDVNVSRRPSLAFDSRSETPVNMPPLSPANPRRLMINYTTEPRSRPASPMGFSPPSSPIPPFERNQGTHSSVRSEDAMSSRFLASPRCERRASSPHRMLVETSFCGPKRALQVPDADAEVVPRGPSPVPSSQPTANLIPIKYTTEPRSRPASPTRSFLNTPMAGAAGGTDSRRGSYGSIRCPSPSRMKVETSFCGPKRVATRHDSQDDIEVEPALRSEFQVQEPELMEAFNLNRIPVHYTTEPRSRTVSPTPNVMVHAAAEPQRRSSGRRGDRSPSPLIETSFVGKKQMSRQETEMANRVSAKLLAEEANQRLRTSSPSPRPLRYTTEPRSRTISPSPSFLAATPDVERKADRMRSPSPMRMHLETSFIGQKPSVQREPSEDPSTQQPPVQPVPDQQVMNPMPVRYATEPRSRPVSPSFLVEPNSSTPDVERRAERLRSPSPNRMLVETSFVSSRKTTHTNGRFEVEPAREPVQPVPDQEVVNASPVRYATEPRSRPVSPIFLTSESERERRNSGRTRSPSPSRMLVETSFVGNQKPQPPKRQDTVDLPTKPPPRPIPDQEVLNAAPVRYATEPRSRPVSPTPAELSGAALRTGRSPSPHRMLVETSFIGQSKTEPTQPDTHVTKPAVSQSTTDEPTQPESNATKPKSKVAETAAKLDLFFAKRPPPPPRRKPSIASLSETGSNTSSPVIPSKPIVAERPKVAVSVLTSFPAPVPVPIPVAVPVPIPPPAPAPASASVPVPPPIPVSNPPPAPRPVPAPRPIPIPVAPPAPAPVASPAPSPGSVPEFAVNWDQPFQFKTFSDTGSFSSGAELMIRADTYNGSGGMVSSPSKLLLSASGRSKPVACPKPPLNFLTQESPTSASTSPALFRRGVADTDSPTSTATSPALFRRGGDTASPSSTTPSPALFRRGVNESPMTPTAGAYAFRTSLDTPTYEMAPDPLPDRGPSPSITGKADKKEGKSRSVLSVLFGKKSKNKKEEAEEDLAELARIEASGRNRSPNVSSKAGSKGLRLPIPSRESSPAGRSVGESGDDLDDDGDVDGFQHQVLDGGDSGDPLDADDSDEKETLAEPKKDVGTKSPKKSAVEEGPPPVPKEEISLFQRQDSLEEELPYVPTTLPIERPIAAPIIPVRMRISEMKVIPTQRPRCSTFIGPCSITDYVTKTDTKQPEPDIKIKVKLPRRDLDLDSPDADAPIVPPPVPIRASTTTLNWEAFAGQALRSPRNLRRLETLPEEPPQPTPSPVPPAAPVAATGWVNVEDLPEPVKAPKAIKLVTGNSLKVGGSPGRSRRSGHHQHRDREQFDEADEMVIQRTKDDRKDSVCSETALLREIDEQEEDPVNRSPPSDAEEQEDDDNDVSLSINDRRSSSSGDLDEAELNNVDSVVLARPNLLEAAPFGMDLDIHSNRSSIVVSTEVATPEEVPISTQ